MSPGGMLIADLRALGASVHLGVDGEPRVRARHGVVTDELRERLTDLKFDVIHLLRDEQSAIDWRVERMRQRLGRDGMPPATIAVVSPTGDLCETCGSPQAYGRTWRCVLCALAAAQLIQERHDVAHRIQEDAA